MKYEEIKIGDVLISKGVEETVISKNDICRFITTIDCNIAPATWTEKDLHLLKPIKEELPEEGLLVSEVGSLVYRLSDGSGYGFEGGHQSKYIFNKKWNFHVDGHWKPATPEQEEQFIEMLKKECERRGLFEDTKIEKHADGDSVTNPDYMGVIPRFYSKIGFNRNGRIFYRGKFATPRKETTTMPQVGKQYTHKKGNIYTVVGFTNDSGDREDKDFPITVIYMDQEGRHWSRPLSRWHGSFELKE